MPPPGKGKYFLAIVPPSPIYEEALSWKHFFREHYGSKASLHSPPHITVHMPFEWREKKEADLIAKLSEFALATEPMAVTLEGFGCFAPRVIFLKVMENPSLNLFHTRLVTFCKVRMNLFNASYRDQPFHPHVTVAFRDLKKDKFLGAWNDVREKAFTATFRVQQLTLLKHNGKSWEVLTHLPFQSSAVSENV